MRILNVIKFPPLSSTHQTTDSNLIENQYFAWAYSETSILFHHFFEEAFLREYKVRFHLVKVKDSFIVWEIRVYIPRVIYTHRDVCRKKKKLKIFISPVFIPGVSNVHDSLFVLNLPPFPLIVKLGSQRFNQPSFPSFRLSSRHFFTAWLKTLPGRK